MKRVSTITRMSIGLASLTLSLVVAAHALGLIPDSDEATLRGIVDKAWSRGERWRSFGTIRDYIEKYSADDEGLAQLVGDYRDRNALQPYADGKIRDLRTAALAVAISKVAGAYESLGIFP